MTDSQQKATNKRTTVKISSLSSLLLSSFLWSSWKSITPPKEKILMIKILIDTSLSFMYRTKVFSYLHIVTNVVGIVHSWLTKQIHLRNRNFLLNFSLWIVSILDNLVRTSEIPAPQRPLLSFSFSLSSSFSRLWHLLRSPRHRQRKLCHLWVLLLLMTSVCMSVTAWVRWRWSQTQGGLWLFYTRCMLWLDARTAVSVGLGGTLALQEAWLVTVGHFKFPWAWGLRLQIFGLSIWKWAAGHASYECEA